LDEDLLPFSSGILILAGIVARTSAAAIAKRLSPQSAAAGFPVSAVSAFVLLDNRLSD
jgi:hypothetical protein